jgi:hypothetical protein
MCVSLHRLRRFTTNRFLTENRFARGRSRLNHGQMQHIRGGDPNRVDIIGGNRNLPIRSRALETKVCRSPGPAAGVGVGANYQSRIAISLGK